MFYKRLREANVLLSRELVQSKEANIELNKKISALQRENYKRSIALENCNKENIAKIETIKKLTDELSLMNNKLLERERLRRKSAGKVGGLRSRIVSLEKELQFTKEELIKIIEKQNKEINHLKNQISPPTLSEIRNGRRKRI